MRTADLDGVTLELVVGDIAGQDDVAAVVNAANAELQTGGGVAGAIHRAAGPGLAEEATRYAPIEPGQCVITGAHDLPNDSVIHCLGPVYGVDEPSDRLLADCYRNALALAEDAGIESVAFPAISSGAFGYPMRDAARVALATLLAQAPSLSAVRTIRFVLHHQQAMAIHAEALDDLTG
ncbi:MAG: macro domain-containing protein [Nitriliruptorales bacterium]